MRALAAAVVFCALLLPATSALSQAGSAGGTIGKHGKSASGGEEPAKPPRKRSSSGDEGGARKKTASRCPNIVGTWNSWASGLFGRGDTTFSKDGTATHRSGIVGKWFCEGGKLHIEWPDGTPGVVTPSDDGKRLLTSDGNVHMSRD